MLIESGEGTLIAGDYVGRFKPGDVYVIGGGQPHVFRCDPSFYDSTLKAKSTSLYFNERYFGKELWSANELAAVRDLSEASKHGLQLTGDPAPDAARLIRQLARSEALERIIAFFQLLALLTSSRKSLRKLSLQPGRLLENEEDRMNRILEFTFRESHRKIYLDEVAQLVHLSTEAFCRYFKLHTRKTYINFLHEVRVSQACRLLISTEDSVEEVCYRSGFSNVSNFNRIFKKVSGKTPLAFRRQVWVAA